MTRRSAASESIELPQIGCLRIKSEAKPCGGLKCTTGACDPGYKCNGALVAPACDIDPASKWVITVTKGSLPADDILATCPTAQEIAAIQRDFKFTFDSAPGPIVCTNGGSETGVMLALINAFRCMKALRFDSPIPLLKTTSIYDWLKSHGIAVRVQDGDTSTGGDDVIKIRRAVLTDPPRSLKPVAAGGIGSLRDHQVPVLALV